MIAFLRRRKLGNDSTKAIQSFLRASGKEIAILRHDASGWKEFNRRWLPVTSQPDYVIRWGYTGEYGLDNDHTINRSEHIHLVNNKPECRKKLIENNISCPETYFDKISAKGRLREDPPVFLIGRPSHHAQGRKFSFVRTYNDLENDHTSDYWSEYIDKEREFRVFTFFGRIIMVAEKVPTEIGRRRLAWNHFGDGAVFENVNWSNWPIESCKLALKASNVIGIDFAGIDVMEKNGVPYILEINSAHSLTSEYRQVTFSKAIGWLIDSINETNSKPEHYQFPEHIRTFKSMILPVVRGR